MLDTFRSLAQRLYRWRRALLALAALSFSITCVVILRAEPVLDVWLLPAIIVTLWALSAYAFVVNFADIPNRPAAHQRGWQRFKGAARRMLYWPLAAVFVLLSIVTVFLSLRLLTIWAG